MSISTLVRNFPHSRRLTRDEATDLVRIDDIGSLLGAAARRRDAAYGRTLSYSRKVFIPLTRLCRDVCHYCTFAHPPREGEKAYLSIEQMVAIAQAGKKAGCKEALFTLGDKPELRYRLAREELDRLGHPTTLSYLAEAASAVHHETGLLPHLNPGLMTGADIDALRKVSVSQGIMLESVSERLAEKGGAHHGSPDKAPAARLETMRLAGERNVPFTSGILIGIGETRQERIDSLLALRDLNDLYGHIQEIIIQNFRPKPDTRMENAAAPDVDDHLWTIAVARLIFEPSMNIQAPPNSEPRRAWQTGGRRYQRLGRRVAGHAGSRQSRSAVAAFAGCWRRRPRPPAWTSPSAWRSIPPLPVIPTGGSITACGRTVLRWHRRRRHAAGR